MVRVFAIIMVILFLIVGCTKKHEDERESKRITHNVPSDEAVIEDAADIVISDTLQAPREVEVSPNPEDLNPAELAQELSIGNIDAWKLIRHYYMNDDSSYIEPLRITALMYSAPNYIRYEAAKILHDHNTSFSDSILKLLPCYEGDQPPHFELDTSLKRQPFYTAGIDENSGAVNVNLGYAYGIDQLYYRSPLFNSEFSERLCSGRLGYYVIPNDMIPLALDITNLDSLDGFYLLGDTLPAIEMHISSITYDRGYYYYPAELVAKSSRMQKYPTRRKDYPETLACYSPDSPPTYIVKDYPTLQLPQPVQPNIESLRTLSDYYLELEASDLSIPVDSMLQMYPDFFSSSAYQFTVVDNGGNSHTRYLLIAQWGVKSVYGESYIVDEEGRKVAHISDSVGSFSHIVHDMSGKESDYLFLEYYGDRFSVALVLQSDGNDHYKSIVRDEKYDYD